MKSKKLNLEIIIDKIEVIDENYYSIDYTYILNGKKTSDTYEGDYEGWSIKEWKECLKEGEALKSVFQKIAEDYE